MIKELGVEKFSDRVKRKLKNKQAIKDLPVEGIAINMDDLDEEDKKTLIKEINEKSSSRGIRPNKEDTRGDS